MKLPLPVKLCELPIAASFSYYVMDIDYSFRVFGGELIINLGSDKFGGVRIVLIS